ncbi:hypothetical protein [Apocheima cinerarium nucleopolyhedrovirus]|uniref:hypothetical protein n=1 Tax=Apocheima cinerarium nucleopolyhedrovirus TaxID=307461 RepID=UPI0001D92043|nr:hypothetical protein [Apocheima cinerarium nucleopolyhedrovirus]ADB84375.1 hypothetical protein [Apocheima cinerarium nucleopolyhedrovirus]
MKINKQKHYHRIDGNFLHAIGNFKNLINTSDANGQRLFYNLCYKFIATNVLGCTSATFTTLQTILDGIIETERVLFDKSRILHYVVKFLIVHSDGDNLQCFINLKLLNYFLTNYDCIIDT